MVTACETQTESLLQAGFQYHIWNKLEKYGRKPSKIQLVSLFVSVVSIAMNQVQCGLARRSAGESFIQDAKRLVFVSVMSIGFVTVVTLNAKLIGERDISYDYIREWGFDYLDVIALISVGLIIILLVIYVCVTHYETTSRQKWIVISLMILVFLIDLVILFAANPDQDQPQKKFSNSAVNSKVYNAILFVIDIFAFVFVGKMIFVKTYLRNSK